MKKVGWVLKEIVEAISTIGLLILLGLMALSYGMCVIGLFSMATWPGTLLACVFTGAGWLWWRERKRANEAEMALKRMKSEDEKLDEVEQRIKEYLKPGDFIIPGGFKFELPEEDKEHKPN